MIIPTLAILITLISSISWGLFDGIRKYLIHKLKHWTLLFYLSSIFSILFLLWLLITNGFQFSLEYIKFGLITIVLNFLANFLYIKAIEISDISSAVPFLAFTSLFTAVSSYLILGEKLSLLQITGILLVVTASFFINFKKGISLRISFKSNQGALMMVAVSLLWAISGPFDKLAVYHSNVISHSFLQSIGISLLNLIMLLKFSRKKSISGLLFEDFFICPKILIGGSLVAATALALQFYAYTLMRVSIFESLKRGIAIITAFSVSSIFFKEKISSIKIIATIIIILGAALILNG